MKKTIIVKGSFYSKTIIMEYNKKDLLSDYRIFKYSNESDISIRDFIIAKTLNYWSDRILFPIDFYIGF